MTNLLLKYVLFDNLITDRSFTILHFLTLSFNKSVCSAWIMSTIYVHMIDIEYQGWTSIIYFLLSFQQNLLVICMLFETSRCCHYCLAQHTTSSSLFSTGSIKERIQWNTRIYLLIRYIHTSLLASLFTSHTEILSMFKDISACNFSLW